jgi:hypothetical protein
MVQRRMFQTQPAAPAFSLTSEFRCGVIRVRYQHRTGHFFPMSRPAEAKLGGFAFSC